MRNEPGKFIEYAEVEKLLTQSAYGVMDLYDLDLFHTVHYVRDAINRGQLKSCKINKKDITITREDILSYWKKYRATEFDPAVLPVEVKLNSSEVTWLTNTIKKFKISHNDLFRAMINHFRSSDMVNLIQSI